jgi:hypothetical protein
MRYTVRLNLKEGPPTVAFFEDVEIARSESYLEIQETPGVVILYPWHEILRAHITEVPESEPGNGSESEPEWPVFQPIPRLERFNNVD